jgi:DNA-binding transcriptional LysR family regulator
MRLTEAGKVLLDYAARIFGLDEAAERAMRELSDLEGGQLAIGASNTIGTSASSRSCVRVAWWS